MENEKKEELNIEEEKATEEIAPKRHLCLRNIITVMKNSEKDI